MARMIQSTEGASVRSYEGKTAVITVDGRAKAGASRGRLLTRELAPLGVRVNAVSPGRVL
jgi:NAD(P)-dependent dehydrogenase (short-subunit alcohol dehydrogenase family)